MLSSLYLLCLIFGGGLALVSALSGVLDTDIEAEELGDLGDMDLDADLDLDADADVDTELDGEFDWDEGLEGVEGLDLPAGGPEGMEEQLTTLLQATELAEMYASGSSPDFEPDAASSAEASQIFSIRGMLYGIFGFGATGKLLEWLVPGNPTTTLIFAVVSAALTSVVVTKLVDWIRRSEAGEKLTSKNYMGRLGEVLLPIESDSPGKIKLTGTYKRRELQALPFSLDLYSSNPSSWDEVFVVEVREGVAYVSPFNEEVRGLKSRLKRNRLPDSSSQS